MALTLDPVVEAAVFDLADALKKPAATVVHDFLLEMAPQFHDLAKLQRLAGSGKVAAAKRVLRHMIGDAAAELATAHQPELFKKRK
jgi:hypothetical protein